MPPSIVKRQVLRARNGLADLAGLRRPPIARTPRDLVWSRETARLWRYRSDERRTPTPVLIVHSLVSRSYILDLLPDNSMIQFLLGEGLDVFLLDWEEPDAADAENTLETYSEELIPMAVAATCEEAGADELTMVGYCFGGVLALLTAAACPDVQIRNLIALATPCDFSGMGFMSKMFLSGRLDPDDVIDDTGLVPAEIMDAGFQTIKPTDTLTQQLNFLDKLWSDAWHTNFKAIYGWSRDQVPFPGAAFRQTVDHLIRDNAMLQGEVPFGDGTARLADIKVPFLNVYCSEDTITPPESSAPLTGIVGSRDSSELCLQAGHIGLVAGSKAHKVAQPEITDWMRRHSRRKPSAKRKKGKS